MQPSTNAPMLTCSECGKANSLDSKFCRGCGHAFAESELEAGRQQNAELIDEGNRILADGRIDEATLIAELAITADPVNPRAYALLGDCHEANDDVSEALQAYEKVVELVPNSPLDKIKVAHLRKVLEARALEPGEPIPARRRAILAAAFATILVGCVGSIIALLNATSPTTTAGLDASAYSPRENLSDPVTRTATTNPPVSQGTVEPTVPNASGESPTPTSSGTTVVRPIPPGDGRVTLPYPRADGTMQTFRDGGIAPINPPVPGDIEVTPEKPVNPPRPPNDQSKSVDNDPTFVKPDDTPPKPPVNPGIIEITPSKGQPAPRIGGSQPIEAGRSVTLLKVAQQQFLVGNYSSAADAYEKALEAGAEPGTTNQRLGQAYDRLGRRSEAVAAYNRAIRTFDALVRSGKGNSLTKDRLNACQQAVRVLGG